MVPIHPSSCYWPNQVSNAETLMRTAVLRWIGLGLRREYILVRDSVNRITTLTPSWESNWNTNINSAP